MTTNHTPGPWRVSDNELGYENFDILANVQGWPNLGIATVVDARFSDMDKDTIALDRNRLAANAALIAQSPALFEALCELQAWATDCFGPEGVEIPSNHPVMKARKVIEAVQNNA